MNVIQWYSDFNLTQNVGSSQIGLFDSAELSSYGAYDVKTLNTAEDEEIAKVYIFNFSTVYPNLGSYFTAMPIQPAEIAADFEDATTYTLYTQGKTRIRYKHYKELNGIEHFWLEYPIAWTYRFEALPYTYGSTNYNWIEQASCDTASFTFEGVYFFSGLFTHDVYGNTVTEEIFIPLCIIHPNANPDEKIYTGTKRGYSMNIIQGFNVSHYEPTHNSVQIGGSGNGNYNGAMPEEINVQLRNTAFSITSGNGQGLTYYFLNPRGFNDFMTYIYGTHVFNNLDKLVNCVISAHIIPFNYNPMTTNIARVFCANVTVPVDSSQIITRRLSSGTMGYADLSNSGYDDFNDISNTTATLYLPFVGRISIDINAIARGNIRVDYCLDVFTGNIGYWVYTQSKDANLPILYGIYTGNCAVSIPVCGSAPSGNVLGKILNTGTSIATGFAESKVKGAIEVYNAVQSFSERTVNRAGGTDTNSTVLLPYQLRLDIERKEVIRTENYKDIEGVPAFVTCAMNELQGFVRVHDTDLSTLSCEENEKQEIYRLLQEGVYI